MVKATQVYYVCALVVVRLIPTDRDHGPYNGSELAAAHQETH